MTIIISFARLIARFFHLCIKFMSAEAAHRFFEALCLMPIVSNLLTAFFRLCRPHPAARPRHIGTLRLDNSIGLAAGFDKNGTFIRVLDAMGFGFIEVGTVTPRSQPGNPKPRIKKFFRDQAIINAMGFNNDGVTALHGRLARLPIQLKQKIIVSISKNKTSEDWLLDIKTCMSAIWFDCGAIALNVSSPNTPGLRDLQSAADIEKAGIVYNALKHQLGPTALHPRGGQDGAYPLLMCKLSPDMEKPDLLACLDAMLNAGFGAVILTNTTTALRTFRAPFPGGGLSGRPLLEKANAALKIAADYLKGRMPIIGVGGITQPENARAKISAGASAVQLYTGFIFKGPKLLWDSVHLVDGRNTTCASRPSNILPS